MKEKKALIVDDDKLIRTLIGSFLEKEGWSFISVENGTDALEVVEDFQPDVITLDYIMPDMSGIDVFKEFKKRNINIPVVFLTISKDDKLIKEFLELGAFGYLTKPFRSPEIIFILTKAYQYKILNEIIDDFEEKDYDFGRLHDAITNIAEKGIDPGLSRRILIDRQKTFQLTQFFTYYQNRQHILSEKIEAIKKMCDEVCPDNDNNKQVVKDLKSTVEDIDKVFSFTEKGLEEILDREKNREDS